MKPIRLIELFSGYGSQALALKYAKIPFKHHFVCDFNKYAIKSYNQLHGTNFETSDITKITGKDLNIVDTRHETYLMTYSFPCQDLSLAGQLKGMEKDSNTRSGLLWEVERLLIESHELPQYLLMENVPQVIGKKNINDFAKWLNFLDSLGYKSYYTNLNAKDYGIPQNRERCFMVSILNKNKIFQFPKKTNLKLRLKDMLEKEVDEKYFLSEKMLNYCLGINQKTSKFPRGERFLQNMNRRYQDIGNSITTNPGNRPVDNFIKCNQVGSLVGGKWDKMNDINRRVYSDSGLSPTVSTCQGGHREPKILTDTTLCLNSKVNGKQPSLQDRVYDIKGVATAITTSFMPSINDKLRIRKLTPRECFRLMGVHDSDFDKLHGLSNSQLYKLAGNSIVTNVLQGIFKKMFVDHSIENYQLSIFDLVEERWLLMNE